MEVKQEITEIFDMSSESESSSERFSQIPLAQQLHEITVFNEVVQEEHVETAASSTGIAANDIGSLLEQFLEYEQASDLEPSSCPDSSFLTPVASPGDSNEDVVLGRLMIVHEKLSREVDDESTPGTPNDVEADAVVDNNNVPERKGDKLLRTVNGVHPKGSKIRMADSPKFAKFKRKKLGNDPPLRRCVSGPNTPRCTSPSHVSPEEMKRREAKLIEALALTIPKQKTQVHEKKTNLGKAKRNLSASDSPGKKRKLMEPLASRLMPVVSKRKKKIDIGDNKTPVVNGSVDPRLHKSNYGELAHTTQLKNTNLVELNSSANTATETSDDISIVDMTIDHESLAGNIFTLQHSVNVVEQTTKEPLILENGSSSDQAVPILTVKKTETHNTEENNGISSTDAVVTAKKDDIKKENTRPPRNYRRTNNMSEMMKYFSDSDTDRDNDDCPYNRKRKHKSRSRSNSRSHSPIRQYSRSPSRNCSHSPSRRRSRSRSSSRSLSRNLSRNTSRKNSISPIHSRRGSVSRSRKSSRSSNHDSDCEKEDISSKLTELSNPVPYDIEHERKVRFLCGGATKGSTERRNIYAGGICRQTTKSELIQRFQRFGRIEKVTLHFRDKGDNYAFIVFDDPDNATRAIQEGNDDPSYPTLELCFGGRRKFVGGSYVDFDGNNSYLEGSDVSRANRADSAEDDFDRLLQMAMRDTKKKEKETTPEWD